MTRAPSAARRLARAKLNLCLHVVGQRADGYHLLESLVAFANVGDVVEAAPGPGLSLTLDGPFGLELDAGGDNLVIRAAAALDAWATSQGDARARGAALRLDKQLPVASGVGGGSADAAATLRLLAAQWDLAPSAEDLAAIALSLGADVPVCLSDAPMWMRGIGEELEPAPAMPPFWIALANPGVAVSTPQVFKSLSRKDNLPLPPAPRAFTDLDTLLAWLASARNDLEAPARAFQPRISDALARLRETSGCRFVRMSGSGATCFGVFATASEAIAAAESIRAAEPGWWTTAAAVAE